MAVDLNLNELLTEYKDLAESDQENQNFIGSIINKTENAAVIFSALSQFEDRQKPDCQLEPLCDLLFTIYRSSASLGPQARQFCLQFIPHLVYLYLQNYSDKHSYHSVETLLVAIYNIEIGDENKKSFKVPSIATSSIYHDANLMSESRIFAMPDSGLERGVSQASSSKVSSNQISHITAQNRAKIVSFLFCLFTAQLGSYSKELLDSSCKVCSRLVLRGFEQRKPGYRSHQRNRSSGSEPGHRLGARTPQSRIFLPSAVYLDMLNLAYFAIFNQCGLVGLQLSKDIEFRARHDSYANVIIVSKAVFQLASSSSARIEAPPISTPSVLTKNMITNASFRTKKLECDIPRVETEEEGGNTNGDKMGIIAEEMEGEVERINKMNLKESSDNPDGADKVKIAEKIKAKMDNVRENVKIPIPRKKDKERGASETSDKDEMKTKIDKKEKKHREKNKNSSVDHDLSSEEFIRMSNLQNETVAIHSPESGNTNIF